MLCLKSCHRPSPLAASVRSTQDTQHQAPSHTLSSQFRLPMLHACYAISGSSFLVSCTFWWTPHTLAMFHLFDKQNPLWVSTPTKTGKISPKLQTHSHNAAFTVLPFKQIILGILLCVWEDFVAPVKENKRKSIFFPDLLPALFVGYTA